ncbi:MAG: phosphopantetheine-binding protein [Pseudomonadota bacterium]
MDELENEIKILIIEALDLEGVRVEDIDSQAALFGEGLNLDSIDALELGLALKNKYNVRLDGDSDASRKHFYSVASLAQFVDSQRNNA